MAIGAICNRSGTKHQDTIPRQYWRDTCIIYWVSWIHRVLIGLRANIRVSELYKAKLRTEVRNKVFYVHL